MNMSWSNKSSGKRKKMREGTEVKGQRGQTIEKDHVATVIMIEERGKVALQPAMFLCGMRLK